MTDENIEAEWLEILKSDRTGELIRRMDESGILDEWFPEILPMKGCVQNSFHHRDVWNHSMLVLENCETILEDLAAFFGDVAGTVDEILSEENRTPLLKMAALYHDIGKPSTRAIDESSGRITFYGHDGEGAVIIDFKKID